MEICIFYAKYLRILIENCNFADERDIIVNRKKC